MPLLWIAGVVLIGVALLASQTAWGYVRGEPVLLVLGTIKGGLKLRADAAASFNAMAAAAQTAGVDLVPSGENAAFRTTEMQQGLGSALGTYGDGKGGLAAHPNFSPHQEGTSLDLNGFDIRNPNYSSKQVSWMNANAARFGWYHTGATFSTVEPWHWEYKG